MGKSLELFPGCLRTLCPPGTHPGWAFQSVYTRVSGSFVNPGARSGCFPPTLSAWNSLWLGFSECLRTWVWFFCEPWSSFRLFSAHFIRLELTLAGLFRLLTPKCLVLL